MSSQDELNKLIGVHLGKAGDGTAVKPYVTPDEVDASLLVPVPRHINRVDYDIDDNNLPFEGVDAWNAYEFSTLLKNGFPVSGWLKFTYAADSECIVESKSVKLYLNSYNMARLVDNLDDIWMVEDRIQQDLSNAVKTEVCISLCIGDVYNTAKPIIGDFVSLENYCDVEHLTFDHFNESANILQQQPSAGRVWRWRSNSLRSNCRVTNQPDWGDVFIHMKSDMTVTPESLLQYIVSMRKENHFHEEICECIYKRLYDLFKPEELFVACLYTRRGGIDINPIRATSTKLLYTLAPIADSYNFCEKTPRQ